MKGSSRPRLVTATVFASVLWGCGGDNLGIRATDERAAVPRAECSEAPREPAHVLPARPLQLPSDSANAPSTYLGETLYVNAGVAPEARLVPVVHERGGVRVAYGRVADGVGADELIEYLAADADQTSGIRKPFRLRLKVRVAEGATREMIDQTVRAVQLINAALPREQRLRFDDILVPREFVEKLRGVTCKRFVCDTVDLPVGDILVQFVPAEIWMGVERAKDRPRVLGQAQFNPGRRSMLTRPIYDGPIPHWAGLVSVDPVRATGEKRVHVLVHEILHMLGRQHPDIERFPQSIMRARVLWVRPGEILDPLDREALHAVYGALRPYARRDRIAQTLASWENTSTHVRGDLDAKDAAVAFGVGLRNGLARPWACGPAPRTHAAANRSLSGSITWSGRVLGFTGDDQVVGGGAELTIRLDTFDGTLRFSALEFWPRGQPPRAAGTGVPWGEGDLTYRVVLRGNRFVVTGADAGEVTGVLLGGSHAAMGGVIDRDGLTAGFGGRQ